jgi:hypothetical protein
MLHEDDDDIGALALLSSCPMVKYNSVGTYMARCAALRIQDLYWQHIHKDDTSYNMDYDDDYRNYSNVG